MSKTAKTIIIIALAALAGTVAFRVWAQTCRTETRAFMENFRSTDFKDTVNTAIAQWPAGPIELPRLGANFAVTRPGGLGAHIYVCDAGDFTGDGYPDFVGLDITRQVAGQTNPMSQLTFIRNWFPTTHDVDFRVDLTMIFDTFNTNTGPASVTVADYNGDGLLDFFFMRNSNDEFAYTNFMAAMYINVGTAAVPSFHAYNVAPSLNFTAKFQAANVYANWAANHLCSVDIDKDGDMDVLAISQDRIFLVRNPGAANFNLAAFDVTELSYDQRTGFNAPGGGFPDRGGSAVAAADFDNDGDVDVIGGSVNDYGFIVYYQNDGQGHFSRQEIVIPNAECTGTVGLTAKDFNNDGWPDIFGATDAWNAGNQAHMWIYLNKGATDVVVPGSDPPETERVVTWEFKCLNACLPIIAPTYDVDILAPVDYDRDSDYDLVLADANHSGDYYLVINMLADIFALHGQAQSTNTAIGVLDERLHAVTRIRLSQMIQSWRGQDATGLKVQLYFSNNGGVNWELYGTWTGSQIASLGAQAWYDFKNFGADVRWRIDMTATEDSIIDANGITLTGSSYDTPSISQLAFEYEFVFRQEYSRSSAAATIVTRSGERKKLVIGSSFIYPGWEGQLRAYDVTAMALVGGPYSTLSTVTSSDLNASTGRILQSGTEIFWDAGLLLRDRSPDNRTIYTAIRPNKNLAAALVRTDFTSSNAALLGPFLQDVNNDNAGLINFIRGQGREWKLGDINHSSPAVVGPPDKEPSIMGAGYADFKEANAARAKVLYVGANDGMLHCVHLETGEEIWGFVPYNLLPKLTNQWKVDALSNTRYYFHDIYVDGSPSVADVQIGGVWKTVLVCGQGPGKGSTMASGFNNGVNFYFALDITDPYNPLPLWEITHKNASNLPTMGETWSVPAIGKINDQGTLRWMAFMGSGYNTIGQSTAGRNFYVVRIDNGTIVRTVTVANVNTNSNTTMSGARNPYKYPDIPVAIVASPTALDSDSDGEIEYVYVGDLDGRLYKMDLTNSTRTTWTLTAIYTDYLYYPIITKPAVWIDPFSDSKTPRIFFGTGGDDAAPATRDYSFISLLDAATPAVEWFIGNPTPLNLPVSKQIGSVGGLGTGYKVWADPVIADFTIYFSTLPGSIENVNPCVNLGEGGRLYARVVRPATGVPVGGSALKSSDVVSPEYLDMVSKARRAVTVGDVERLPGNVNKREVFMQEYNSTIEMLEHPVGSLLQIKSWREIYQIIR
jgi:hypothetical protein